MNYSKFNSKKTVVDGITFSSKREAKRFSELKLLERAKQITCLELQKRFAIEHNGVKICSYVCDFAYYEQPLGNFVVEDSKGFRTPIYSLKKKLMKAFYGITIRES
jgi:hypothetical protein